MRFDRLGSATGIWARVAAASLALLPTTPSIAASQSNAALAIDRKDGSLYGWAVDHATSAAARSRATSECLARGGKCQVVLEFSGGCGAYAVERGNNSLYGWATANSRQEAETRALAEARDRGGKDLLIRVWGCNSGKLAGQQATVPGRTGVHFIYALRVKSGGAGTCFLSNVFYVPGVAVKTDRWTWSPDASAKLAPFVARFDSAVKAKFPTGSADLEGGWRGGNELDIEPKMLDSAMPRRKTTMTNGHGAIRDDCGTRGYAVVPVSL